jgi:hypothetical protein
MEMYKICQFSKCLNNIPSRRTLTEGETEGEERYIPDNNKKYRLFVEQGSNI